ncbi:MULTISPECIES: hypothetical protein [Rheinheimera]|uniref:Uncharacterized protein n=1 Tax=Rheinheimera marina TaxID=1774958 RepID=A0ABV9JH83_9GAMM
MRLSLSVAALLLSACQHQVQAEQQAAVLLETSAQVRQEIQQAIQQAIGGDPVKLADNVFLFESEIWIENAVLRDEKGRPLDGRIQNAANLFQLKLENGRCVLRHNKSNQNFELQSAHCVAEKQRYPETTQ